ncbi:SgcJ/EcaC family oxidoreductase [Calidifontibacillus erzurumensis]|uniref:SgcJ/EcaC family oxidoreductase n=1 Tax=Calidifontibacillus erzurumensis TaxID=2741433 RepID=UPI0035B501E6
MNNSVMKEIETVYKQLLNGWNNRNAREMADVFAEDGEMIGFDGSLAIGKEEIFSHLKPIFDDHPTGKFVSKVKNVRQLGPDIAILRAIAGMVPAQQSDINPAANTHHTVVAKRNGGKWVIELFQNTPAQFHGRPHLVEEMTAELREVLNQDN